MLIGRLLFSRSLLLLESLLLRRCLLLGLNLGSLTLDMLLVILISLVVQLLFIGGNLLRW